jgi:predicted RNA-binding protein with RPS1 domain
MILLGCVAEIRDFELLISLPNGMYGTVGISNISNHYTSILEQLASGESDQELVNVSVFIHLVWYLIANDCLEDN